RMIVADGRLAPLPQPAPESEWVFPLPFGSQTMIEIPFSEIILIASHLRASAVHTHLNRTPLLDLRDPATPPPEAIDESGRSGQTFLVDVAVRTGSETRRLIARGQDIYAFTAPLVC